MELLQELGSRSWINGSGKKDSRKFGLFQCPVCKDSVEKSMSHGKRDKNCGSKECRKATFERNPNQMQTSFANGNSKKSKYSMGKDPLWRNFYKIFIEMHARCYNEVSKAYRNYGAKGISVSSEWHDIEVFTYDMFSAYKDALAMSDGSFRMNPSLDREDPFADYSAHNCKWIPFYLNANKDKMIPVARLDLAGNILETYCSMSDASKFEIPFGCKTMKATLSNIQDCCNGRRKTHLGFKWTFATSKTTVAKHSITS